MCHEHRMVGGAADVVVGNPRGHRIAHLFDVGVKLGGVVLEERLMFR